LKSFLGDLILGAGLGLYISKKIVDMHGGRFWAQNNQGMKGATFTFTLPVNEKLYDITYGVQSLLLLKETK
jgi:signal transduction histidine kinase